MKNWLIVTQNINWKNKKEMWIVVKFSFSLSILLGWVCVVRTSKIISTNSTCNDIQCKSRFSQYFKIYNRSTEQLKEENIFFLLVKQFVVVAYFYWLLSIAFIKCNLLCCSFLFHFLFLSSNFHSFFLWPFWNNFEECCSNEGNDLRYKHIIHR